MGYFSFRTQDTDRSICNIDQNIFPPFCVYMIDDKGNKWEEKAYEGYGEFGGKDYYELIAEMNGVPVDDPLKRDKGLTLAFVGEPGTKFPNLVEFPDNWQHRPFEEAENCDRQGFFYDED